ncbi:MULTISPECIES: hypothetical protein [Acinetobacter]|uniref:hypothetical protein n=1 Tax=Acinetobacter TaxID=469 RepID=UPI000B3C215C|nr:MULTISPECIES: hypothetical protein [Acinetobacter]AXY59819.1 hypothetical protein CDG61_07125 [Acinetobacter sp. WCHAc010052]WOE42852.1 hypothetical protein QSG87_06940 [Acinetobacter chinensis]
MMNKLWYLPVSMLLITGCATTHVQDNTNLGTKGLLICQPAELCPVLTVVWNETHKDVLKVKISLNDAHTSYNIQKVVFTNGEKSLPFNVTGPTEIDRPFKANRSRNSVLVPVNLVAQLGGSSSILMNIHTDKGVISRHIVKDDVKAPVFQELVKYYKAD